MTNKINKSEVLAEIKKIERDFLRQLEAIGRKRDLRLKAIMDAYDLKKVRASLKD